MRSSCMYLNISITLLSFRQVWSLWNSHQHRCCCCQTSLSLVYETIGLGHKLRENFKRSRGKWLCVVMYSSKDALFGWVLSPGLQVYTLHTLVHLTHSRTKAHGSNLWTPPGVYILKSSFQVLVHQESILTAERVSESVGAEAEIKNAGVNHEVLSLSQNIIVCKCVCVCFFV